MNDYTPEPDVFMREIPESETVSDCPYCEFPEITPRQTWDMKFRTMKVYKCPMCNMEFNQWTRKH